MIGKLESHSKVRVTNFKTHKILRTLGNFPFLNFWKSRLWAWVSFLFRRVVAPSRIRVSAQFSGWLPTHSENNFEILNFENRVSEHLFRFVRVLLASESLIWFSGCISSRSENNNKCHFNTEVLGSFSVTNLRKLSDLCRFQHSFQQKLCLLACSLCFLC